MEEAGICASYPVAERHNPHDIVSKPGEHSADNVEGRSEYDNCQQQQKGDNYVELAQTLDAYVNTGQHGCHRYACYHYNQQHHGGAIRWNPEQIVEPRGNLLYPQAERGCESKHPCEYGECINDMSGPTPDAVTEYGIKC